MRVRQDRLHEKYIVGSEVVGEGAGGAVVVVTDRQTRQRRVLKSLHLDEASNQDRLINEMEVYLKLDHPNICRLLEVFVEESACHMIMEHCEGRELFERWDGRGGVYSEQDTCVAISMMLSAVAYLHSNRICHRDLKLENFVYADGAENARLKLIDFGFSKIMQPGVAMTDCLGTVYYMAPEVLEGSYDYKCDLWSIGVIAFMLLTGHPPFGEYGEPDEVVMDKVRDAPLKTYLEEWVGISDLAKSFVCSLLDRDPARRPTAKEAAAHPWLVAACSGTDKLSTISREVLQNLRAFASTNAVKRAACCLIAYSMKIDESDELEAQFKGLDLEGDGNISVQAMVGALKEHLGMSEESAHELFRKLDLTGDQKVRYSEFLAATCQRRFLSREHVIRAAFERFDTDRTGNITLDNLREVLGDHYGGVPVEDVLGQVDHKQNGVIEYDEFVRALFELGSSGDGGMTEVKSTSRAYEFTSMGCHSPTKRMRAVSHDNANFFNGDSDAAGDEEPMNSRRQSC